MPIPLYDEQGNFVYRQVPTNDFITEVEVIRYYPEIIDPNTKLGTTITNKIKFLWSWAEKNGWATKDNWKKNPAYMMVARCVSRAARIAASDIVGGLYDDYEQSEIVNIEREIVE